jgi:hypothetical protein
VRDSFVRSQTTVNTYARVCEYVNPLTGTRLFIQYQPLLPKLPSFKVTLISDDLRTLSHSEIFQIVQQFDGYRLLLIEIALEFGPGSEIDIEFLHRHGLFGKSRPNTSRSFDGSARYGGRHSDKLVRCYRKDNVNSFRVELELHSRLLRRNGIVVFADLRRLPNLLFPRHICFVRLDWAALVRHLSRRGLDSCQIVQRARTEHRSLYAAMTFLRTNVGVRNVHRFLRTIPPSGAVFDLLKEWSLRF